MHNAQHATRCQVNAIAQPCASTLMVLTALSSNVKMTVVLQVAENGDLRFTASRAQIIDELETTIPAWLRRRNPHWYPKFVHILTVGVPPLHGIRLAPVGAQLRQLLCAVQSTCSNSAASFTCTYHGVGLYCFYTNMLFVLQQHRNVKHGCSTAYCRHPFSLPCFALPFTRTMASTTLLCFCIIIAMHPGSRWALMSIQINDCINMAELPQQSQHVCDTQLHCVGGTNWLIGSFRSRRHSSKRRLTHVCIA